MVRPRCNSWSRPFRIARRHSPRSACRAAPAWESSADAGKRRCGFLGEGAVRAAQTGDGRDDRLGPVELHQLPAFDDLQLGVREERRDSACGRAEDLVASVAGEDDRVCRDRPEALRCSPVPAVLSAHRRVEPLEVARPVGTGERTAQEPNGAAASWRPSRSRTLASRIVRNIAGRGCRFAWSGGSMRTSPATSSGRRAASSGATIPPTLQPMTVAGIARSCSSSEAASRVPAEVGKWRVGRAAERAAVVVDDPTRPCELRSETGPDGGGGAVDQQGGRSASLLAHRKSRPFDLRLPTKLSDAARGRCTQSAPRAAASTVAPRRVAGSGLTGAAGLRQAKPRRAMSRPTGGKGLTAERLFPPCPSGGVGFEAAAPFRARRCRGGDSETRLVAGAAFRHRPDALTHHEVR
jgi:hypothetical protein